MKQNILFIMNNLNCGGAEKALISLLDTIDYTIYNVDLFLFKHEGMFLSKLPEEVNLLKQPSYYQYFDMPIKTALTECINERKYSLAFSRLSAGWIFKTEKNHARCEQRVWKYLSHSLPHLRKEYDVAIGYLEKNPIYFCVDKVKAKKKIGFIHNDYHELGMDFKIDEKYFRNLDSICTVSEKCAETLRRQFPLYKHKVSIMYNIVSPSTINKMAKLIKKEVKQLEVNLVSVGRLHNQKGFDMAIEACAILKKEGYKVKWKVIGEGGERDKLERMIKNYGLEKDFILLGVQENPYPYIKNADIFVQSSRYEGKSIAIDEAKILQKPIIATNFSTIKDQISHEENGLIVSMDADSIATGIEKLIRNENLRNTLVSNLSKEELGTESEIIKLYKLFNAG